MDACIANGIGISSLGQYNEGKGAIFRRLRLRFVELKTIKSAEIIHFYQNCAEQFQQL